MSASSHDGVPRRPIWRAGRAGRIILALGIAVALVLAGVGVYVNLRPGGGGSCPNRFGSGGTSLTVYTYSSFLGGLCNTAVLESVFGSFADAHHATVTLVEPSGTLLYALAHPIGPPADVVIGLDEVTATIALQKGLVVPYTSPALSDMVPGLAAELSPNAAATPYEYGYLGIDYNSTFNSTLRGAAARLSLPEIAGNLSWAENFLYENPTTSIVGEEFLVSEIAYYQSVLHEPWQRFWNATLPVAPQAPDWYAAFNEFSGPTGAPGFVVSYTTDPAYAAFSGTPGIYNSTVPWWNGTAYGWRTIYGAAIVQGSAHPALDEALINWLLSPTVQKRLPTNEWEYPANATVPVPPVFRYAESPKSITPLNGALPPSEIATELPGWLSDWQTLAVRWG
ncbi:MAG: thiamine ABC transporter substrate-binding protein [Thermoplasmata archaeon]